MCCGTLSIREFLRSINGRKSVFDSLGKSPVLPGLISNRYECTIVDSFLRGWCNEYRPYTILLRSIQRCKRYNSQIRIVLYTFNVCFTCCICTQNYEHLIAYRAIYIYHLLYLLSMIYGIINILFTNRNLYFSRKREKYSILLQLCLPLKFARNARDSQKYS